MQEYYGKLFEDKCGRMVLYLDGRDDSLSEARHRTCLMVAATRDELIHLTRTSKPAQKPESPTISFISRILHATT